MKLWNLALLMTFLSFNFVCGQSVQLNKVDDSEKDRPYPIDTRQFLEKEQKLISKFLMENPNYFEENKA